MGSDWASSMPGAYHELTAKNAKENAKNSKGAVAGLAVICGMLVGYIKDANLELYASNGVFWVCLVDYQDPILHTSCPLVTFLGIPGWIRFDPA
jgi:hypothetical protein